MNKKILLSTVFAVAILSGCASKTSDIKVNAGDIVSVTYVGSFEDGRIFDTNDVNSVAKAIVKRDPSTVKPLTFTAGNGEMIPGFDKAVIGMASGEKKSVTLTPAEGYGEFDMNQIQAVPRDQVLAAGKTTDLQPITKLTKGDTIILPTQAGYLAEVYGFTGENDKDILMNFMPMKGKALKFDITVISVEQNGSGMVQ